MSKSWGNSPGNIYWVLSCSFNTGKWIPFRVLPVTLLYQHFFPLPIHYRLLLVLSNAGTQFRDLCLTRETSLTNLITHANSSTKLLCCKSLQDRNLILVKLKPTLTRQQLCCTKLSKVHGKHQKTLWTQAILQCKKKCFPTVKWGSSFSEQTPKKFQVLLNVTWKNKTAFKACYLQATLL